MKNKLNSDGIAHIGFVVKDLKASRDFYINTLGFESTLEYSVKGKDVSILFLSLGNLTIELIENGEDYSEINGKSPNHLAISCCNIENQIEKLKNEGVLFETDSFVEFSDLGERGCRFIMFRGLDGERLELQEML